MVAVGAVHKDGSLSMSGFRAVEVPRAQLVLWEQRLDDAIPPDHAVRQVEYLLSSRAFSDEGAIKPGALRVA